jgi:hypothetical protein
VTDASPTGFSFWAPKEPSMNAPEPSVLQPVTRPMPHVMNTYGRLPIARKRRSPKRSHAPTA